MQMNPYVFKRDGAIVARLESTGVFLSNADGAGWYSYDSLEDFFADCGVPVDPINYITQIATLTNSLPEIDMAQMQAALQGAQAAAAVVAPAPAPAPAPKPKRGRAAKPPAGADAQAPAPAPATTPTAEALATAVAMTPAQPPIPQVPTPAPTTNVLQDPAVQRFLASQRAAAEVHPPLPVPVAAEAGAITTPFTSDGNQVPQPQVPAPVHTQPPAAPVQLPTGNVTLAVDALIQKHGIANVAGAFVEWAITGAEAAAKYGLTETAKRLRDIAAAHRMGIGL